MRALHGEGVAWTQQDEMAALTLETVAELTQRYGKVHFKPPRGGWVDPALHFPRPWEDPAEAPARSAGTVPVSQRPPAEVMALIFKQRMQVDPHAEGQPKKRTARMRDRSAPSGMYAAAPTAATVALDAPRVTRPARGGLPPRDARGRFVKASDISDGDG